MKTAPSKSPLRVPLTEARVHLGALIKRVHLGKEYVILEKDGIPVVGLMDAGELEDYLELSDPKVRAHIKKSNEEYLTGKSRPMDKYLAERAAPKAKKVGRRRAS